MTIMMMMMMSMATTMTVMTITMKKICITEDNSSSGDITDNHRTRKNELFNRWAKTSTRLYKELYGV